MLNPALVLAITIDINPVAFSLGPVDIHWYGLAYVAAILVGLRFIRPYAAKRGVSEEQFDSLVIACAIAGFAGGRLYYVIQNDPGSYLREPWRVIEVWNGGMAFFGAIFAVLLTLIVVSAMRKWPVWPLLDAAALFAMIGQPIGRLGNVANGDILGPPSDVPWAVIYPHPDSFAPSPTTAYHPAMFYEMLANFAILAILLPLRNRLPSGVFALAYLVAYAVSQVVVFIWRSEPTVLFGLRQAQVTAIAVLAIAVLAIVIRLRMIAAGGRTGQAA